MNISEINPYIRLAIHSELPAPFLIKRRIIFDYELLYIEGGEMILTYDDIEYLCKKGDILLLCPGVPHSFNVPQITLIQPHIHFDMTYDPQSEQVYINYKDYPEMTNDERSMIRENIFFNQHATPFLKISNRAAFLKTFYEIIDSGTPANPRILSRKAKMLTLIETILAENTTVDLNRTVNNPEIAFNVRSFIHSNYHQKITLDVLEQHFGYSKYYIEKVFKSTYGISVINYRNRKRMEAALHLLKKHTVSETANLLGYSSIYAFSKAFSAHYKMSPTKYAQKSEEEAQ